MCDSVASWRPMVSSLVRVFFFFPFDVEGRRQLYKPKENLLSHGVYVGWLGGWFGRDTFKLHRKKKKKAAVIFLLIIVTHSCQNVAPVVSRL